MNGDFAGECGIKMRLKIWGGLWVGADFCGGGAVFRGRPQAVGAFVGGWCGDFCDGVLNRVATPGL